MQTVASFTGWHKRKLFVATPMYGAGCTGPYVNSLLALQAVCIGLGIELRHSFIFNESLITRARNRLAATFLEGESTHLMFIDADIGFRAEDVIAMLRLMEDEAPFDVMAGVYPTKSIAWDRVRAAALEGRPDISRQGSRFVFNLPAGTGTLPLHEPARALYVGTGFMMIRRATFERVREATPTSVYLADDGYGTPAGEAAPRRIHMFFQAAIDPRSGIYLSEDYYFCQQVDEAGGQIWICPWISLDHVGTHTFSGALSDLGRP